MHTIVISYCDKNLKINTFQDVWGWGSDVSNFVYFSFLLAVCLTRLNMFFTQTNAEMTWQLAMQDRNRLFLLVSDLSIQDLSFWNVDLAVGAEHATSWGIKLNGVLMKTNGTHDQWSNKSFLLSLELACEWGSLFIYVLYTS